MGLLDAFHEEMNKTAYVYAYSMARDASGHVISSYAADPKGSAKGMLYQTGASNRVINDKYRQDIDSLFITDPVKLTITIDQKDKILIDSDYYEVLYAENIGRQDQVIQIGLKKYDG